MGLSFKLTMPDIAEIAPHLDALDQTVLDGWQQDAGTLLQLEIYKVTERTMERAFDTGALAASVTGTVGSGKPNLVSVWFNSAQQYAEWGRYYAPYQEGEPLGLATYTNGPRHMLYDSVTDDAQEIGDWATQTGQRAADALAENLNALPEITL